MTRFSNLAVEDIQPPGLCRLLALLTLNLWIGSYLSLKELLHTHVSSVLNGILQVKLLQISGVLHGTSLSDMLPSSYSHVVLADSEVCHLYPGNCHLLPGFPSLQQREFLSRNSLQPVSWDRQTTFDNLMFKNFLNQKKKKKTHHKQV